LTAQDLEPLGIIDRIVPEPLGGAHHDPESAFSAVGRAIASALEELEPLSTQELLDQRFAKFDAMGVYEQVDASDVPVPGKA
jgi:acetyl-CoA carboxylase carboxyl transferase subunit alpha